GQNRLDDKHVGLYWTFTDSSGGYIDAVAMQSRYDGRVRSYLGLGSIEHWCVARSIPPRLS
ncbi:hypothetical protein ABE486_20475, partial [Stenotrophomonas sp. TWI591]|uniref:hypothetical protein n=1 Tax=Stenotrophomonas sp. TWI591 TaxID=3136784 RepID=UPI003207CFBB